MKSRNQTIKLIEEKGDEISTSKKEINDKNFNVEVKRKNSKPGKKKIEPIQDVSNVKKYNNAMNVKSKQRKYNKTIRKINSENKIYDKVVIDTAAGIHLVHNKD